MDVEWLCCFKKPEDRDILIDCLPRAPFKYRVTQYELIKENYYRSECKFRTSFETNVCTEDQWKRFLEELSANTNTSWNINRNVDKRNGKFVRLSGARKCLHNIEKKGDTSDQTPGKNTFCPSKLTFKIMRSDDCKDCELVCTSMHCNY